MTHYDVYRYGGPPGRTGQLTIDGARLTVVTDDPELARQVAWVNAVGYVHKWESIIDTELGIGDAITPLPIAETSEFMAWFSRELGGWQFVPRWPAL